MKIGNLLVPETRLEELLSTVMKKIYSAAKTDQIQSKDLSELLGYKYGTEPTLFKRINSMLAYGILEGRGVYNITKLGEGLLYPENPELEKKLKTEAVMNVELWKKLYEKHGKNPPKESLWVSIKSITEVDPATARKYENRIYDWYTEDMTLISGELINTGLSKSETLRSSLPKDKQMSQQMIVTDSLPENSFGRVQLSKGGYIDVIDETTLNIAKSYIKLLEQKIKEKKLLSEDSSLVSIEEPEAEE